MKIELSLKNDAAPLGDMIISYVYYQDRWDGASIINDAANILLKTPIVHFKSMEYNFAKLEELSI